MNKYKKLMNNSLIFTIGNFGSRLITFFMVPLYTQILTTTEYGSLDIVNTTINFLIPFTTLELGQAALRYAIDASDEIKRNKLFSNLISYTAFITVLILLITPALIYLNIFENLNILFSLLLISRTINNIFSQYIRGIGLVKEYAVNGILTTLVVVSSNIVLLVVFDFKVGGYIFSLILSAIISNIYLLYSTIVRKKGEYTRTDKKLFKSMLTFSVPIIPNSAMWWTINGSTRYFILYFIGASSNGIYAVANKLPSIISLLTGIFSQAWQLSSFEEYESVDREKFYSTIFNIYWVFLFVAGSGILAILKPLLMILVEQSYYISWQVVPLLILAVIYQSFSAFLGTNYTAAKETKGTFFTSVYGGIISLISSMIFIPTVGLIGAGVSSALSFIGMFYIRLIDTKKFIKINIDIPQFLLTNLLFIIQTITLFYFDELILFAIQIFIFCVTLLVNKKIIYMIANKIMINFIKTDDREN